MKQYTKFAKKVTILSFILLLFGWIYYYLYLYNYLPEHSTFDVIYSIDHYLLMITPIIIIILWLFLLAIKKPRFQRLHTNLILFLTLLFFLNLFVSIYSSREYLITGQYTIVELTHENGHNYVTIQIKDSKVLLDCRDTYYKKLKIGDTYHINYRGNELIKKIPPTITSIAK